MNKQKYKFNPESLKFDKARTSVTRTIVKVFTFVTATLAVTVVYYLAYSQLFNTPKERVLLREIEQMTVTYASLTQNLQKINYVLADIQLRDSNIYRTIFESEPVTQTVLRAGFGGVSRHEALEGYSKDDLMIEKNQRINMLSNQLLLQSKLMDETMEIVQERSEQMRFIPAIQPIENDDLARTAAGFGMRMHPFYRTQRLHEGIDFAAPVGTPVRATADGVVVEAGAGSAQGHRIIIDHGYGYKTVYAHLDRFHVRTGQRVRRGEKIGEVGNTGLSIAPHLHYEVHKNGTPVDPINYFFGELSPADFARIRNLSNLGRTFD